MYWVFLVIDRCVQFDGRSRRKEFWIFVLFSIVLILALFVGGFTAFGTTEHPDGVKAALFFPLALCILAIILPGLAVTVRRLHDTGKSGWMIMLCLIPIIGGIILLVFTVLDSEPGPNRYGPNPKLDGRIL
ncbi:MAG: DUF805 domain-containing protein [Terracidiphilus sp.]|jgi:uncharacterized membrane protein YhaH (DUF805 family)